MIARIDPRLRLSAVIIALQVLGQTVLGFKLSIPQILVPILICLLMDGALTFRRTGRLAWPASAMLTGNSVAFILRTSGTQHGDWWSFNGIEYFVLAALLSMLSKYFIRMEGRHLYNPSNFGLVAVFLLFGPAVFPQYLWWGPIGPPVIGALVVIAVGALWVLWPVRMFPMAVAFIGVFFAVIGAISLTGRCFAASWAAGPVCGPDYWANICLSPELLIFVFFMMSDPRTAPESDGGRVAYGAAVAALASLMVFFQPAEYGVKVAVLAALTIVCSAIPFARWIRREPLRLLRPAAAAAIGVVLWVSIGVVALAGNRTILQIESSGGAIPGTNKHQ